MKPGDIVKVTQGQYGITVPGSIWITHSLILPHRICLKGLPGMIYKGWNGHGVHDRFDFIIALENVELVNLTKVERAVYGV